MRVLVVGNFNLGYFSPFVREQIVALRKVGIEMDTYGVVGKGFVGYLRNVWGIRRKVSDFQPDILHAHYGLSGLCANLQRKVPVITTYHGSDIHSGGLLLRLSQLAMRLSAFNIFVSTKLLKLSGYRKNNIAILPCGIDMNTIRYIRRNEAKEAIKKKFVFVLFSGSFANEVKNATLAQEAMKYVKGVELVELKGYNREELNLLMNAADCLLLTSHREGSPQVVKEAMACGTPIVSVDVGDVKEVIGDTEGCFIAERTPEDIAEKIKMALDFKGKTNGRQRIIDLGLSNEVVAKRLIKIYEAVLRS